MSITSVYMAAIARHQASMRVFAPPRQEAARACVNANTEAEFHAANALLTAYVEAEIHFRQEIRYAREVLADYTAPWFEVTQ